MAAPQQTRLFTVDEANALLPELKPLVARILKNLAALKEKSEVVIREERLSPSSPELMKSLQQNAAIATLIQEVKCMVEEINAYGCICKGIEEGLVDFPCQLGGEIVFLCWRFGEDSVGYWHRIEDGFAGRKPLLDSEEENGGGNVSYH
ncbi:MAG TPA: DUF2203 domain-containing protein [Candidatus Binatia bacterium]|jgi:hypothetical protein